MTFNEEFRRLEKQEFIDIIGYDELYEYISRFHYKTEKVHFLKWIIEEMHSRNVLIHPDSVDGSCYLSSFRDPSAIQILFTLTAPRILQELQDSSNKREKIFQFKMKKEYREIEGFQEGFYRIINNCEIFDDNFRENEPLQK
jgi:hypothetical protein